jgi:hypothetical protein
MANRRQMGRPETRTGIPPALRNLGAGFGSCRRFRNRSRCCWLGRRRRNRGSWRRRCRLHNLFLRGGLLGSGFRRNDFLGSRFLWRSLLHCRLGGGFLDCLFRRSLLGSSLLGCLLHGFSSFLRGLLLGCHSHPPRTFFCSAVRVISSYLTRWTKARDSWWGHCNERLRREPEPLQESRQPVSIPPPKARGPRVPWRTRGRRTHRSACAQPRSGAQWAHADPPDHCGAPPDPSVRGDPRQPAGRPDLGANRVYRRRPRNGVPLGMLA